MGQAFKRYWLGGSPCAGKSTVAELIADRFGFRRYHCDDHWQRHQTLVFPERQPVWSRLAAADCNGIWMRPVAQQVAGERAIYEEQFPLILADLEAMGQGAPVVVEGAALLPELVATELRGGEQAIWLVPSEAFQRKMYGGRDWRHEVLQTCSDPDQAWKNWMARDALFARRVAAEAQRLGFPVITVDGSAEVAAVAAEVRKCWWLEGE